MFSVNVSRPVSGTSADTLLLSSMSSAALNPSDPDWTELVSPCSAAVSGGELSSDC